MKPVEGMNHMLESVSVGRTVQSSYSYSHNYSSAHLMGLLSLSSIQAQDGKHFSERSAEDSAWTGSHIPPFWLVSTDRSSIDPVCHRPNNCNNHFSYRRIRSTLSDTALAALPIGRPKYRGSLSSTRIVISFVFFLPLPIDSNQPPGQS